MSGRVRLAAVLVLVLGVMLAQAPVALADGEDQPPVIISATHQITIEKPGTTTIRVSSRFQHLPATVSLAMSLGPAGKEVGFNPYGFRETLTAFIRDDSAKEDATWTQVDATKIAFEEPRGPGGLELRVDRSLDGVVRGDLRLEYVLDLNKGLPPDAKTDIRKRSEVYKDRVVVTETYATLHGNVLFYPSPGRPPPAPGAAPNACLKDPQVRVVCPEGWTARLPADQNLDNFVFKRTYRLWEAVESVRWFGLAGRELAESDPPAWAKEWASLICPSRATLDEVAPIVWERVQGYHAHFGTDPLKYLAVPRPEGDGMPHVYLFGVPYPSDQGLEGAGGQCMGQSAYFFYAPDSPRALGPIVAHEYFHFFNDGALIRPPREEPVPTWFIEGYTELRAVMLHMALTEPDEKVRVRRLKLEMAAAWATMAREPLRPLAQELGLEDLLPPVKNKKATDTGRDGRRGEAEQQDVPLTKAQRMELDNATYDRLIRGRAFLVMFRIGSLLKSDGVHAWFVEVLKRHRKWEKQNDVGIPPTYQSLKSAALAHAGPRSTELKEVFEEFIEKAEKEASIGKDLLKKWLDDPALLDLARPVSR